MTVHAGDKTDGAFGALSIKQFYILGERVPHIEGVPLWSIRAQWTGDDRPPLKGEFFLRGTPIIAYQAHENLIDPFPIARLVEVREVKRLEIVRFL